MGTKNLELDSTITLGEVAELWWKKRRRIVPERDTPAWRQMYAAWIEYAFPEPKPAPKPLWCIRLNGSDDLYLHPDGTWGCLGGARKFADQDKADAYARKHLRTVVGLFPACGRT